MIEVRQEALTTTVHKGQLMEKYKAGAQESKLRHGPEVSCPRRGGGSMHSLWLRSQIRHISFSMCPVNFNWCLQPQRRNGSYGQSESGRGLEWTLISQLLMGIMICANIVVDRKSGLWSCSMKPFDPPTMKTLFRDVVMRFLCLRCGPAASAAVFDPFSRDVSGFLPKRNLQFPAEIIGLCLVLPCFPP